MLKKVPVLGALPWFICVVRACISVCHHSRIFLPLMYCATIGVYVHYCGFSSGVLITTSFSDGNDRETTFQGSLRGRGRAWGWRGGSVNWHAFFLLFRNTSLTKSFIHTHGAGLRSSSRIASSTSAPMRLWCRDGWFGLVSWLPGGSSSTSSWTSKSSWLYYWWLWILCLFLIKNHYSWPLGESSHVDAIITEASFVPVTIWWSQ